MTSTAKAAWGTWWLMLGVACGSSGSSGGGGAPGAAGGAGGRGGSGGSGPVCTTCTPTGEHTFSLPAPAGASLWTTTTMDKVLREAAPPATTGTGLRMFAAKNEHEPLQIVLRADAAGSGSASIAPFSGPGKLDRITWHRVDYVKISQPSDASSIPSGEVPDPLVPVADGAPQPLAPGKNQPMWMTVYVPPDAPAGDYTSQLTVTIGGVPQVIPVSLHVFDFALPAKIGFDGNWNTSFQALGGGASLEAARRLKDHFREHRLVPAGVAWPAGLNYDGGIDYDCASGAFVDGPGPYDFAQLGPQYIDGVGWDGVGFPSFEVMQFVDNSTPRPDTFCGVPRGPGHVGTPAYDAAWSKLLSAIDGYVSSRGWRQKAYYYVQNEPQDQADYDTAARLAALTKAAAPHLRIAVSEEPKPEIAENPLAGGASYDLWWANLSAFDPAYAATRQARGEQVWWYFLYGDAPPRFNPITIDHPGIESRIAFWAAWRHRIAGFAYYSVTGWGSDPTSNPRPQGTKQNGDGFLLYPPTKSGELVSSIRWELLREGEEDFEYFLLAQKGKRPETPSEVAGVDTTVGSAVASTTSFTRDAGALQHLRNQLGAYLEGKADGFPVLSSRPAGAHPREPVYLNFQDPDGEPKAAPLLVDGKTWQKIGWAAYDPAKGFGWAGENIGDPSIMLYRYLPDAPVDERQRSVIYDDYGRTDTFSWDIEPGRYEVTVSIGWYGKTYAKQRVVVEGAPLFDGAATTPDAPYKVASVVVDVADGSLSVEVGQKDEYTMLNWLSVEPR
ncbi:MAG: DUF4091 domain-containing protein [Polyangiaceae bacterium]|nr:DUF4091 domain-containing protein [Polyangiaceae bacterium]